MNRYSHFSRYRSSRDQPSSVEDRDLSPRAGLRYNTGYSDSSNLPKLKLNNLDGNPLEWPEWSSMFIATVDQRPKPDTEKMSHLKTLLTGKTRAAISGMGYSGQFYGAAWSILERKFGRPHVIIVAQLESLCKASQVKPHNSTSLISFSVIVSNFVNVLKETENVKVAENIQTWWDIEIYASKMRHSVKEWTAGTKDARQYDDFYRRATRSGNAVEWTRAKPTEQLQLSLGSASLTGAKIPKGPKPEEFVSTVNRYRCGKRIRKNIGRVRSERHLRERMLFATPSSAKPEQAWQVRPVCNAASKYKRSMPKW